MPLLSLVRSDSPCGGCIGGTLASDGPATVETSDSVEKRVTLRLCEGLQKWRGIHKHDRVRRETVV